VETDQSIRLKSDQTRSIMVKISKSCQN
jgi:hypothetical protein